MNSLSPLSATLKKRDYQLYKEVKLWQSESVYSQPAAMRQA